jgi:hypothetical protein
MRRLRLLGALLFIALANGAVVATHARAAAGGDTLYPNESLSANQRIQSTAAYVVMQGDGNLVEYDWTNVAIWSSATAGHPGSIVVMQGDGNLVIYAPGTVAIWASGTAGHAGASVTIQRDGNFVMYQNGAAIWATNRPVYNRNEAVQYEEKWCGEQACLNYTNGQTHNPDYVFFSDDCTNFVSQALRAGFKRTIGNPRSSPTDDHLWWDFTYVEYYTYAGTTYPQNSHSASVAQDLDTFLYTLGWDSFTNSYWLGSAPSPAPAYPAGQNNGDLYFYSWRSDGSINHVDMQVGSGVDAYSGWVGDYVDSHTSNRYHIQWTLTEKNPNWQTTTAYAYHVTNNN